MTVFDQILDRVGLIKAHPNDARIACRFDRIARTSRGTLVTAEDADYALRDIILRNALGFRRVTLAILGLQKIISAAVKRRTETDRKSVV